VDAKSRYLVELESPQGGWADLRLAASRAREAARELQEEGLAVRFLRTIFVPEDDACFFLYEGPSREAVAEAASRAALVAAGVQETIRRRSES